MSLETRVYVDMAGDLFHCGHVNLLHDARAFGDWLVVGVLGDDTIASYKRTPIMTLEERVAVISACRYVDEVISPAPFRVTRDFIDRYDISYVVHGDDMPPEVARDIYEGAVRTGIYRSVPYTSGVSTTDIIRRVREAQTPAAGPDDVPGSGVEDVRELGE